MLLFPRRLSVQIFLLVAMILVAMFIAYGWITNAQQSTLLRKTMMANASAMVENFAESCAHYLVVNDYAGLENFVQRVADLPNIRQLQVCEADGKVLADIVRDPGQKPEIRYDVERLVLPTVPTGAHDLPAVVQDGQLVVWRPILAGTMLGWVKTTYSMDGIDEMQAVVWRSTFLLGVVFMAASITLLLLVLRPPLAAIRQLSQFARKLNEIKGQYVQMRAGSLEIEHLAESLNSASRELLSTEQQLVAERERLSVTLQSIMDGVIATDTAGNVILMNKVAEQLTGWPAREAHGRPLDEVFRVTGGKAHHAAEGTSLPLVQDPVLVRRDDTERYIEHSKAPIIDSTGEAVGVVLVFRDVTGHRQMVAERVKLEEQLRHAQKMEAVGQLAGGIAHDFNNILSAIIGYANLLQLKATDNPAMLHLVDPIVEAGNRAASLTHSLLSFSRKQVVDLRPQEINAVVSGVEKILRRLIRENIEFSVRLQADPLVVVADRGQMEQVLVNLVANARDAMPVGGTLVISTETAHLRDAQGDLPAGAYAVISVSDTGVGMDPETQAHIFEPFFTTKGVGKGTGLGLSIVYGIVRQHNGIVHVYSEPGRGTAFRIYLPLAPGASLQTIKREDLPLPRGSEAILLVEDDADVRRVVRAMLEEFGYTVLEAADSAAAIDLFRGRAAQVRLVLTDVIMPGKDGRELVKDLTMIRPDTKVLYMSGYTADIIVRKDLVGPGVHYISKPLTPDTLIRKVRDVLDG